MGSRCRGLKFCSQRLSSELGVVRFSFFLKNISDIPSNARYPHTIPQNGWCSDLGTNELSMVTQCRPWLEGLFSFPALCTCTSTSTRSENIYFDAAMLRVCVNLGRSQLLLSGLLILGSWMKYWGWLGDPGRWLWMDERSSLWILGGTAGGQRSLALIIWAWVRFIFFMSSSSLQISLRILTLPHYAPHSEVSTTTRAIACCSDMGWMNRARLLCTIFHWTDRSPSCSCTSSFIRAHRIFICGRPVWYCILLSDEVILFIWVT